MENDNNKESINYLNEQIANSFSAQKQESIKLKEKGNFFERNKKLIIIIGLILTLLFIIVNIYIRWGLNYTLQQLSTVK